MPLLQVRQSDLKSYCVVDTSTEKVYKSTYGPTGSHVFIKLFSLSGFSERARQKVLNDVEYVSKINSDRLMQMIGIYQTPNTMGIVMHWMPNGSLHALIYQRDLYPTLPLSLCSKILSDVAEGLTFLHNLYPSTVHQHLKPCNILLDGQYLAKLSDFHLQKLPKLSVSKDEDDNAQKVYLSPQRLQGNKPTPADDIYSLGIITHETLSRKRPFHESHPLKLETEVLRGHRPQPSIESILKASNIDISQSRCANLSQFTNLCWHPDPNMRLTAAECLYSLRTFLQTFSDEESKRDMKSFVNKKEVALQHSQAQTCVPEFHIKLLDDSWTSHRNRTQSAPEESTRAFSSCSGTGKEIQRCATMPVKTSKPSNQITNTEPLPRAGKVGWTHGARSQTEDVASGYLHGQGSPESASKPVKSSRTSNPMTNMGPLPRADKAGWTNGETGDHCTCYIVWNKSFVDTLLKNREVILSRVTEGHLNQLIDTMVSRQVLLRDDMENIKAEKTPKARVRKYLDTCYEKGEEASRVTLEDLLSEKIISLHQKHPV
ncbi:receptor-interacting serine/threonine-protein kinase 2-like [Gastrophryne carolinensis]